MEERKESIALEPVVGAHSGVPDFPTKASSPPVDHLTIEFRICLFMAALRSLKRHTHLKFPLLPLKRDGEQDDLYFDRLVCG